MSPWLPSHLGVPPPVLQVGHLSVSGNNAIINCTFLDGSSHYCLLCCGTDPSVPAGSAVYLSSTKGPSVSVSVESLGSNQTYYCKASATDNNLGSCGSAAVGDVRVYFSFMIINTIPPSPPSSSPSLSATPGNGTRHSTCTCR